MKLIKTILTITPLAISTTHAATIASQDFNASNFPTTPTSFVDGTNSITHTGSGATGTDLGFEASGKTSTNGALAVTADEHFRFAHFSSTSNRSDLAFTADSTPGATHTGFILFNTIDLSTYTDKSLSMTLSDNLGATNSQDDELVVRLFLNGSSTGLIIFDTRGVTNAEIQNGEVFNGASITGDAATAAPHTLSFNFDNSVTSAQLRVDTLVDDEGNDGYYIDNISFQGTAAIPEPTSAALISIGSLGVMMRRKR